VSVYLRDTTRKRRVDGVAVTRTAQRLLDALGESASSVSLSFVGDAGIRRMNLQHRGADRPTDVLSFPLLEPALAAAGPTASHDGERMLGDVVISVDTALRQAAAYDAPLERELERLLIHGLLHLLGHDHHKRGERARMEAEERRLAAAIGLPWPY
jgi:probable rRNA maturation factor